jgi:hypothetical protein
MVASPAHSSLPACRQPSCIGKTVSRPAATTDTAATAFSRQKFTPLQTIIGLKVREVYERITEKEVVPVS